MVVRSPRPGTRPNFVQSIMKIRPFETDDLPQIITLVQGTFNEAYDYNIYLDKAMEWPGGSIVAEIGTEVIGYLLATTHRPLQTRILILGIKEGYRGHGVGKTLMHALMNRSIIKGNRSITLEVRVSNDLALAFYAKLGFEMIGMIPKFYSSGESAFLLKKVLY